MNNGTIKFNTELINERFLNQPFYANRICDYLETLGYTKVELGKSNFDQYRFRFWQAKSPRTLFVSIDNDNNNNKKVSLHMSYIENTPNESNALGIGCLVIAVGFMLFGLFSIFSSIFDGSDSDHEEYNPYTED